MHRVVSRTDVAAYVEGRVAGTRAQGEYAAEDRGDPEADWIDLINDVLDDVLERWQRMKVTAAKNDQARDQVEGKLAAVLHAGLSDLPADVLLDRDFWRYCAAYLYDFVVWRQPSKSVWTLLRYFGGTHEGLARECVPHRMFNRAHIVKSSSDILGREDPYALSGFGASDVWKSHILRVANGNAPLVAAELLEGVRDGMLKTELIRPTVKNLRRARANVIFEVLDPQQTRDLVSREVARARDEIDSGTH